MPGEVCKVLSHHLLQFGRYSGIQGGGRFGPLTWCGLTHAAPTPDWHSRIPTTYWGGGGGGNKSFYLDSY